MWTYFHLGNAHRENGDCQRAAAAYRNAVRLRPELLAPYPDLAACLIELGRLEEARQALTAGLRIDPSIEALQETMALLERIEARHARIRSGNQ
jgi:Flp pilus assembly protein TadD